MFEALTNVTVAEYIRRRRLTLAAQELASSPVRVLDVALKYGYESPGVASISLKGIPPASRSKSI
jgi:AraC family transcriptional regulator